MAGGAAAFGALGVIGGAAHAAQTGPYTGVTDSDSGSHADNAGHGRGPGGNSSGQPAPPQSGQTGYSDSDGGANADPSGGGRRGQRPHTGITDRDPTDPCGEGRGTSGANTHNNTARRPDGSLARWTGSPTPTAARPATPPITARRPRLPRQRQPGARLAAPRSGEKVRVRGRGTARWLAIV